MGSVSLRRSLSAGVLASALAIGAPISLAHARPGDNGGDGSRDGGGDGHTTQPFIEPDPLNPDSELKAFEPPTMGEVHPDHLTPPTDPVSQDTNNADADRADRAAELSADINALTPVASEAAQTMTDEGAAEYAATSGIEQASADQVTVAPQGQMADIQAATASADQDQLVAVDSAMDVISQADPQIAGQDEAVLNQIFGAADYAATSGVEQASADQVTVVPQGQMADSQAAVTSADQDQLAAADSTMDVISQADPQIAGQDEAVLNQIFGALPDR